MNTTSYYKQPKQQAKPAEIKLNAEDMKKMHEQQLLTHGLMDIKDFVEEHLNKDDKIYSFTLKMDEKFYNALIDSFLGKNEEEYAGKHAYVMTANPVLSYGQFYSQLRRFLFFFKIPDNILQCKDVNTFIERYQLELYVYDPSNFDHEYDEKTDGVWKNFSTIYDYKEQYLYFNLFYNSLPLSVELLAHFKLARNVKCVIRKKPETAM